MARAHGTGRHALTASLAAGLLLGGAFQTTAQEQPPPKAKNTFYTELGGCGLMTVNYERVLWRNVSLRLGGGMVPLVSSDAVVMDFVVMPSLALGSQRHRFSAGAGLVVVRYEADDWALEPTSEFAYRFRSDSGFVFRAALGLLRGGPGGGVVIVPGAGVGWSF